MLGRVIVETLHLPKHANDVEPPLFDAYMVSDGGSISHALAIYDIIAKMEKSRITAAGVCASAAIIVLQAAKVRRVTPETHFLFHDLEVAGDAYSEYAGAKKTLEKSIRNLYVARMGEENYQRVIDAKIVNAQAALQLKLVDEIGAL